MLQIAQEYTPLRPVSVRVGQISGSAGTGAWNKAEWFPAMLKSSQFLGCLPALDNKVRFIPCQRYVCDVLNG